MSGRMKLRAGSEFDAHEISREPVVLVVEGLREEFEEFAGLFGVLALLLAARFKLSWIVEQVAYAAIFVDGLLRGERLAVQGHQALDLPFFGLANVQKLLHAVFGFEFVEAPQGMILRLGVRSEERRVGKECRSRCGQK